MSREGRWREEEVEEEEEEGRGSLWRREPQVRGLQPCSSELITPSISLSDPGREGGWEGGRKGGAGEQLASRRPQGRESWLLSSGSDFWGLELEHTRASSFSVGVCAQKPALKCVRVYAHSWDGVYDFLGAKGVHLSCACLRGNIRVCVCMSAWHVHRCRTGPV